LEARDFSHVRLHLAYAITVHKSQGSEYGLVVIILSDEDNVKCMLRRDLLFTAISRAKQKCIIIEKESCLKKTIENNKNIPALVRKSSLLEKIVNFDNLS